MVSFLQQDAPNHPSVPARTALTTAQQHTVNHSDPNNHDSHNNRNNHGGCLRGSNTSNYRRSICVCIIIVVILCFLQPPRNEANMHRANPQSFGITIVATHLRVLFAEI